MPLQKGYLADHPSAVAALAQLRRGAGKEFQQVPDLWGRLDLSPLHHQSAETAPLRERELTWAEDAVHVAVTLWALHQQSRSSAMHRPHTKELPTGLGAAVRQLVPDDERGEPVRKRFVRVGTAATLRELADRLRGLVVLLRGEDIAVDYALLAGQLYAWQQPGGRDAVRRAWGRSFQAYRPRSAADNDNNDNSLDKDAS
ncbi:type I-E CRISPR-associated protein Cse2/CasB [Streptomyces endophytica]|uniref:Type I-E CRISPR-associated protein Cse2/CasB n=1 Tax=Streptomyces endophytica TaxID=2991496 RepID=A0ABY6PI31_9ACTN|nr:type I-E CRISPR-associated protein Cse2/CasB [Streptomyces endophytica]UZJ33471.1 type I-E CRISPR-associated protein Cse2/CasB [Streptomyces endophytica]